MEIVESWAKAQPLRGPEDVEFFFDVGEVFVAGGEGGFLLEDDGGVGRKLETRN